MSNIFTQTITTEAEAVYWVARLHKAGKLWHFDDDPRNVHIELTDEQCEALRSNASAARLIIVTGEHFDDIFDVALQALRGDSGVYDFLREYGLSVD